MILVEHLIIPFHCLNYFQDSYRDPSVSPTADNSNLHVSESPVNKKQSRDRLSDKLQASNQSRDRHADQSQHSEQARERSHDRLSDQSRVMDMRSDQSRTSTQSHDMLSDQSRSSNQSRDMMSDQSRADQLSDQSSEPDVGRSYELTGGVGDPAGVEESMCMRPEVKRLLERLFYLTKKLEVQVLDDSI